MALCITVGRRAKIAAKRAAAALLPATLALCGAASAQPAAPLTDAQLQQSWRATIAQMPVPQDGCFKAAYPSTAWIAVACTTAPKRLYLPRGGHRGYTVGNGNDYAAAVTGLIASGVGSFPSVQGVKTEKGYNNQPNTYSLQLNSQFFASPVCSGAADPASCLGWQQFVYTNSGQAFMQYWLINYGSNCPAGGWMAYSGDCYRNSNAVSVPTQAIAQLHNLQVTGTAIAGGNDTMVMTTASKAYSVTGKDSVVDLAGYWNGAEYNIIGDGGGSQANFNKGSKITVQIALKDGGTAAPTCESNAGTTGETNNLNLGSCTVAAGATPSLTFFESR